MNNNGDDNVLYELAKVMRGMDRHLTATALHALAKQGFTSLAEVEGVTDCELLAIGGIGPDRLGAIRRLTQPDWQPPSRRAIRAASRLLSAAQLALRFWGIEDLEATLAGDKPVAAGDKPIETRLSLEAFAGAAREAADHHKPDTLKQIVQRASMLAGHDERIGKLHDPL
jgi:hypothetical protein